MEETKQSRYLEYLPAIFQEEPFLGHFLQPFENTLAEFDELLAILDRYVSPAFTPAADFLPWLATWVSLLLDEEWEEAKRRRLISEAVELYRWRGAVRGLKRYLEIYTGLPPTAIDIHEGQWPGGMQIGVASRIGATTSAIERPLGAGLIKHDYYVVDTRAPTEVPPGVDLSHIPDGEHIQLYYRADLVEKIEIETGGVRMWVRHRDQVSGATTVLRLFHRHPQIGAPPEPLKANIFRRSELIDYVYTHPTAAGAGAVTTVGGTFLIEQLELPYHFIVDVRESMQAGENREQTHTEKHTKVRAILDLEKPAHTDYYLKFTPVVTKPELPWMQIEVYSSIALDTTVG